MADVEQPLRAPQAKERIRRIVEGSGVRFTGHAMDELERDELLLKDAFFVLRSGTVYEPEWENGEWRYRVETLSVALVVAFTAEDVLWVVTGWRKKP